jgi:hypothetical protein
MATKPDKPYILKGLGESLVSEEYPEVSPMEDIIYENLIKTFGYDLLHEPGFWERLKMYEERIKSEGEAPTLPEEN